MQVLKKLILLFALLYMSGESVLMANSCSNKLFTLKIEPTSTNKIKLQDILYDLASSCQISILYADDLTKSKLKKDLGVLYINDFTLDELFKLLLNEHNLFYTYDEDNSRLKIAYLKTKSFNIDYINVTQMRTYSARDVTVGASNNQNEDMMQFSGQQGGGSSSESGSQSIVEYSSLGSIQKGENSDFTSTKTIADFTFWDELKDQIEGMLQRGGDSNEVRSLTMINRDAGLITVSGSHKQLTRVEAYIERLQKRMHKQVLLEVRIMEVTYTEGQQKGIDWSKFDLSLSGVAAADVARTNGITSHDNLYTAGFSFSMEGLLNFLKQYGEVEILSSPKVMTLNNQPALINVGDQINYKYENGQISSADTTVSASSTFALGTIFVGLSLSIIPEVTENGHIILRINPVDSRIIEENVGVDPLDALTDNVRSIPPDMKIKQMTSIVKVKDGSKVLIGGLVQKESVNTDNKVPLLGDIPYLGRLFHSTSVKKIKKEFFIVVVPKIIKEDRMPTIEEKEIIERTEDENFDIKLTEKEND